MDRRKVIKTIVLGTFLPLIPKPAFASAFLTSKPNQAKLNFNSNWQKINEFQIEPSNFKVNKGENLITVDCYFDKAGRDSNVKVEIRSFGKGEKVVYKN